MAIPVFVWLGADATKVSFWSLTMFHVGSLTIVNRDPRGLVLSGTGAYTTAFHSQKLPCYSHHLGDAPFRAGHLITL